MTPLNIRFEKMLENEDSFDRLFCDTFETSKFKMFYNSHFAEDPIFNHSVISTDILNSERTMVDDHSEIFDGIRSEARKKGVPPSIFVERFWRNSESMVKSAIEAGYLISGGMELLSKNVNHNFANLRLSIDIEETQNVELWNEVFMRSYNIDSSWKPELLAREKSFQKESSTHLFLARERNGEAGVVGCTLLHEAPKEWMGVYCVGTVPEKRHQGVAKNMMRSAELFASEAECSFLTLQTIMSDGVAPLYQSIGFNIEFARDILRSP